MRVDLTPAVVAAVQAESRTGVAPSRPVHNRTNSETLSRETQLQSLERPAQANRPEPPAPPASSELSVSLDDRRNVIYRFLDPDDGSVRRQVPPEEILRIMRNIEDLLKESEQKLDVSE